MEGVLFSGKGRKGGEEAGEERRGGKKEREAYLINSFLRGGSGKGGGEGRRDKKLRNPFLWGGSVSQLAQRIRGPEPKNSLLVRWI